MCVCYIYIYIHLRLLFVFAGFRAVPSKRETIIYLYKSESAQEAMFVSGKVNFGSVAKWRIPETPDWFLFLSQDEKRVPA